MWLRTSETRTRSVWLSLFLLSAATLTFEINLTRLFSVAQFYHFAFMIVSIALLGFGASGTALAIFPTPTVLRTPTTRFASGTLRSPPNTTMRSPNVDSASLSLDLWEAGRGYVLQRLTQLTFATGVSILVAFLLTNGLPFDSFSIAWDPRQVWILILHYVALAAPFFFSGMALGFLLSTFPASAGTTYAVNLFGSATGCVLALVAPASLGGEGTVMLSMGLASIASLISALRLGRISHHLFLAASLLLSFSLLDLGLRVAGQPSFAFLELRISPYKSLSYALQFPGSQVIQRRWNAFSRIDIVRSGGIHSLPGLSYRYLQPLPSLDGLLVDGDDLSPVMGPSTDAAFVSYLPNALAFHLRGFDAAQPKPQSSALILEPRGGLDVLTALALGAEGVTVTQINPLIVHAVSIYQDPRLRVYVESDRSYLRRAESKYDVIVLSLISSFHPVRSGAYTLAEDYRYTVESFQDALGHLSDDGLLVATRWLQDPPSEDLRLFALAVTALERNGANPRDQLVAFRGFNTATVLLKNTAFTPDELSSIRAFLGERAFDLTYAPDVRAEETNQYNILPEPTYYQRYVDLLNSNPREMFYEKYEYDVRPPTDDHPFFGHYFKWVQAPQVIAEFGKAWQPFGGAGYFVIVALLLLATLLAAALILLPVAIWRRAKRTSASPFSLPHLIYFGLLGFAFLFVEIPLLQRFILYLGQPAFAFTTVLFSLLFFSGLGSRFSDRIPLRPSLPVLVILVLATRLLLPAFFSGTLGLPLAIRMGLTALLLAPLGLLMGVPFPAGIRLMKRDLSVESGEAVQDGQIAWVWAVNGASSVVASILSALLALTFGFSWVLTLGALCYAGVWAMAWRWQAVLAHRTP